ncbi:MAG: hypothetical protein AAGU11_16200 [Syntrophobacteraceae bacterium]
MPFSDFDTWYSVLTSLAVRDFDFLPGGVAAWNKDGWKKFWQVKCPPRHALLLMHPEAERI